MQENTYVMISPRYSGAVSKLCAKNAEKMIKRIDKQRHNYYKYITGKNRGDREGKLLMFDVSAYGIEKSVDLLCEAIRIRLSEKREILQNV